MKLFSHEARVRSARSKRVYALYELAYTVVDFAAAAFFVVGSALFFREETTTIATWLFLIGSLFFGLKPTLRIVREIHLLRCGDVESLAKRLDD